MRHRKSFNHLGRTASHRGAMLSNMATSLIMHKRISTTTAKAKALRMYVEPLINKSKEDSTHSRRTVFSYLQNKEAVSELFREISPKIIERMGGFTRIFKTGKRLGDNADMCIIELVDFNQNLLAAKDGTKSKSGVRRRRGLKKKTDDNTAQAISGKTNSAVDTVVNKVKAAPAASNIEDAVVVVDDAPVDVSGQEEISTDAKDETDAEEKEVK